MGSSTDYFALLNYPRLPWLDPEALQARFIELSSLHHPDKLEGASEVERSLASSRFAELNAAHHALRDPKTRLAHLLTLETGGPPQNVQRVEAGSADLFFQIGTLCRQADQLIAERARATSPLIKAGLFAQALGVTERLQATQEKLGQMTSALENELQAMNSLWAGAVDHPFARLEEIYRQLGFLDRWSQQLRERFVQLAV